MKVENLMPTTHIRFTDTHIIILQDQNHSLTQKTLEHNSIYKETIRRSYFFPENKANYQIIYQ